MRNMYEAYNAATYKTCSTMPLGSQKGGWLLSCKPFDRRNRRRKNAAPWVGFSNRFNKTFLRVGFDPAYLQHGYYNTDWERQLLALQSSASGKLCTQRLVSAAGIHARLGRDHRRGTSRVDSAQWAQHGVGNIVSTSLRAGANVGVDNCGRASSCGAL